VCGARFFTANLGYFTVNLRTVPFVLQVRHADSLNSVERTTKHRKERPTSDPTCSPWGKEGHPAPKFYAICANKIT
jgi:hypothetical protein